MKLAEAASLLGVQPATLRQQIRSKRLRAKRMGRDWYVTPAALEKYRATYRRDKQPDIEVTDEDAIRFMAACYPSFEGHTLYGDRLDRYATFKGVRAHRFAWVMDNGPIPPGVQVRHSCDVASCVRPDHLYIA